MPQKKHLMQFSKKSFNKYFDKDQKDGLSLQIQSDHDTFGEMQTLESFEQKFNSLSKINNATNIVQQPKSSKSQSRIPTQQTEIMDDHIDLILKLIKLSQQDKPLKEKYHKICQEFGINFQQLQEQSSTQAKEDFILKQMSLTIQEQLKHFFAKNVQKMNQYENQFQEEQKHTTNSGFLNLFDWLKVKTQFNYLNKRLKYALINLTNEQDNQDKMVQFFKSKISPLPEPIQSPVFSNSQKNFKRPESTYNILQPYTTDFFSNRRVTSVSPSGSSSNLQFENNLKQNAIDIDSKMNKKNLFISRYIKNGYSPKTMASTTQLFSEVNDKRDENQKKKLTLDLKEQNNIVNVCPPEMKEWNMALEKGFLVARQNAQSTFTKEINSSSWNQNGLYPIVYSITKKNGGIGINNEKRVNLLDQYQNGDALTAEEMKFLANTSSLINKGIDKKFIQRAINFLDQEIINQIETNIAEQTLKSYYDTINDLSQKRSEWMSKINIEKRKLNKQKDIQLQQRGVSLQKQHEYQRIKQKLHTYLRDIVKKSTMKKINEHRNLRQLKVKRKQGDIYANRYIIKFKEKVMDIVRKIRDRAEKKKMTSDFAKRNYHSTNQKVLFEIEKEQYNSSQIKRLYHPSSKLFLSRSKEQEYELTKEQRKKNLEYNLQEAQKYKIVQKKDGKNDTERIADRKNEAFKNFYSGGPSQRSAVISQKQLLKQNEDEGVSSKQTWITKNIEIVAINKIKKAIRTYIQAKKYKQFMEEKINKKNKMIEQKIQRCLQAKRLFEFIQKEVLHKNSPAEKVEDPNQIAAQETNHNQNLFNRQNIDFNKNGKNIKPEKKTFFSHKERNENNLKHRKLLIAAKLKNILIAQTAGFQYNSNDVNCQDALHNSPLFYTARNRDEHFCRYLLNLGADVNQKCENGNTPLHMAFKSGSPSIVVEFLNLGGNLNVQNDDGHTPIAFGNYELLSQLNLKNQIAAIVSSEAPIQQFDNNADYNKKFQDEVNEFETQELDFNLNGLTDGIKILDLKNN